MAASRLTLEQAAAELLAPSPRWLNEWLRAHPRDEHGVPYYTPVGRAKVFLASDITRIEQALRGKVKCVSRSGRRAKADRRTTKSGARTSESEWTEVAALINDPSLSTSSAKSRSASKNMAATQRPRLNVVQGGQPS